MNVHSSKLNALKKEATLLAVRQGLHATSMAQIARSANIAVGTIYLYYSGKDELYGSLLSDYYDQLTDLLTEPPYTTDFKEVLRLNFDNLKNHLSGNANRFQLFLQLRQLSPYSERAKAQRREFEQKLSLIMEEGKTQVLLKNLSINCLATLFFEGICSISQYELEHPNDHSFQTPELLKEACFMGLFK